VADEVLGEMELVELHRVAELAVKRGESVTVPGHQLLALLDELLDALDEITVMHDQLDGQCDVLDGVVEGAES
jgi:hypothetical protein